MPIEHGQKQVERAAPDSAGGVHEDSDFSFQPLTCDNLTRHQDLVGQRDGNTSPTPPLWPGQAGGARGGVTMTKVHSASPKGLSYAMCRWLSEDEHSISLDTTHDIPDLVSGSSGSSIASSEPVTIPETFSPKSPAERSIRSASPIKDATEMDLMGVGAFSQEIDE
jgi:hypothetical protein